VDSETARERLREEKLRLHDLLSQSSEIGEEERVAASDQGDMSDSAEPLTSEQEEDAIAAGLRERLEAIERAEKRLDDGTYGLSVRSGLPIPDERLEADPAAELNVDEIE
jgi:DnaK suppressor protein